MFSRTFHPERFLRGVYGTEPFADYCRDRSIPFAQVPGGAMFREDARRWTAALAQLPCERQRQVEWELSEVNELADRESLTHLLAAVEGRALPSDLIPGDAALALWFFLHHRETFQAVFLNQEILEVEAWRNAQASPGQVINDPAGKAEALAASLRECFQLREGTGRFCVVDIHRVKDAYCFVAHVADRLQVFESFTEDGEHLAERLRPAFPVLFVYYPQDGTILLRPPLHAAERSCELFERFGRAVLGRDLGADCLGHTFALDRLKTPFQPLPDAEDMQWARVKTLHFRYPQRLGRRQIKLETLASDTPLAVYDLIRTHLSGPGVLDLVQVSYAELQVLFNFQGQSKSSFICLWPNRCNLNGTPYGQRRAYLKRWGIYHAQ